MVLLVRGFQKLSQFGRALCCNLVCLYSEQTLVSKYNSVAITMVLSVCSVEFTSDNSV